MWYIILIRLLIDINFIDIDTILKEVINNEELIEEKNANLAIATSNKKNNNNRE